jgi:hypothetical protein
MLHDRLDDAWWWIRERLHAVAGLRGERDRLTKPIRWWLLETLPRGLEHARYWLRAHTTQRRHIIDIRDPANGYAWGWLDRDGVLLFAAFTILRQYVEKERPFDPPDRWAEGDPEQVAAGKELRTLYDWWTQVRPADLAAFEPEDRCSIWNQQLRDTDDAMLRRLIALRGYMWT